jgi:hypothetical protein
MRASVNHLLNHKKKLASGYLLNHNKCTDRQTGASDMTTKTTAQLEQEFDALIRSRHQVQDVFMSADRCSVIVTAESRRVLDRVAFDFCRVGMSIAEMMPPSPYVDAHTLRLVRRAA